MYWSLLWKMIIVAIPVIAFSPMFASLLGYTVPSWGIWVAAIFGTVMFVWGGRPFLEGAVSEIRARQPGMMLLVSLGISVAFLASWAATLGLIPRGLEYWWELALLIVIMLAGHWIEMKSLAQTSSALDSLAALLPDEAEKLTANGEIVITTPAALRPGDQVLVRPGGRIPADGVVREGSAAVDESMMTGESRPVPRSEGEKVVAGTVATDSGLTIEVTATGEDTALAGIQKLVAEAENSTSPAQRLADRAAGWLFWFALGAAIITAIVWAVIGTPQNVIERVITVLVIACPHSLGLAIPLVVSISTGKAAASGILIKDRLALEQMREMNTVVFDKTGTLTTGKPEVTGVITNPESGLSETALVELAAAVEQRSEHPLARAIVTTATEISARAAGTPALPTAEDFRSVPGLGVSATVNGARVQVGGARLLAENEVAALPGTQAWDEAGSTVIHVLVEGRPAGALRLDDAVRPESALAVRRLQERGINVVMMTGDAEPVARAVAEGLGISEFYAGVRPEEKAARIKEMQSRGARIAMVGDGVNDAPALAQAEVGIAIGAGTDVAIAAADIILAADDPRAVNSVITLSQATTRKMKQNLWWAAGYNLLAVPLAAGVLAPIGFIMPMSVGAVLMAGSTVIVALNAQLLRRVDLRIE
ncbi:heavy metal translocating P-type ATPase [Actinobaculum suis]|nr:heavy metal translocating P-type ATPase [Actinobaculum suis]